MWVFITDCFEVLYLHLSVQCIIMFDFLLTLFLNKELTPALVLLIDNTNILFALFFKMQSGPIIFMCEEHDGLMEFSSYEKNIISLLQMTHFIFLLNSSK